MDMFFKSLLPLLVSALIFSFASAAVKAHSFDGSGKVLVSWSAIDGAEGYAVYRSDTKDGTYQLIKKYDDSEAYSMTDIDREVGQENFYKVCGFFKKDGIQVFGRKSEAVKVQIKGEITDDPEDPLMLVNKNNWLSSKYVPTDLVPLGELAVGNIEAKEDVKAAYDALYHDAMKSGYDIKIVSAYRDYALQKYLFSYWCEVDGVKQALRTSAKAGRSEHQTGYALDVSTADEGWDLQESFGDTAEGKWLSQNAYKYGFIIRYDKDTEAITGYAYEPWHIRYVGKTAAKEIFEQNVTLEEYLGY